MISTERGVTLREEQLTERVYVLQARKTVENERYLLREGLLRILDLSSIESFKSSVQIPKSGS